MNVNSVHSVIFSPCGGTQKIMEAITKDINLPKYAYNVTLPKSRKQTFSFSQTDLVFFAFPVYGGHIPRNAADIFNSFQGNDTPAVLVVVYGNRVYEGALLDMNKLALAKGFKPIAASAAIAEHSLAPVFAQNRPDNSDIKSLAKFGPAVLAAMEEQTTIFTPPGFYPDWPVPPTESFLIKANESCTSCGLCEKVCPTGAVAKEDLQNSDPQLCIICAACLKYCPVKARDFVNQDFRKMGAEHLKNAITRKEAEFFFSKPDLVFTAK